MLNRRRALAAIKVAVFGGVEWFISSGTRPSFTAVGAELAKASDESLTANLARLGARVYSEEGIPMFLACQNVPALRPSEERAPAPSVLNRKVASAFHRYSEEWQHIHPAAPATDVAKIVELLADRDFADGGTERSL